MSLIDLSGPYVVYQGNVVIDSPPGGNGNGLLDPGESASLVVALKNLGRAGVNGLAGRLRTQDPYITVLDSAGTFGNVAPDSVRSNNADRFRVRAAAAAPRGHSAEFMLHLSGTGYADSVKFTVRVGEMREVHPIPDGPRLPPLYWAYDDADSSYPQRPSYSWVEIKSQGMRLYFPNDDGVLVVNLPAAFGPFKYYGQRYTRISVSADGWIVPDHYTTPAFNNTYLPSLSAPPGAICPNWDDLYPDYGNAGSAYYYHDEANHRFVVEFDSVAYYDQTSVRDKFEVIFYDTTLAAADGNSVFDFQYMTANRYTSSTVGIQDAGKTIGIQALYNGDYHAGCRALGAGRAIRFTTDMQTGVAEPAPGPGSTPRSLLIAPNPTAGGFATLRFSLSEAGPVVVTAFDIAGRSVLRQSTIESRQSTMSLDLRKVPAGVYLVRLDADGCTATAKLVVQRDKGKD